MVLSLYIINTKHIMKQVALFALFFTVSLGFSQSEIVLPIDFEKNISTSDFTDFNGGTGTVIANTQPNGTNLSPTIGHVVRNSGDVWAGSKIQLAYNLDFSTLNFITMKIFTTAPTGTTIRLKLEDPDYIDEGDPCIIRDVWTTVSNEWETLEFNFTGAPSNFDYLVFMFDYGNVGNGSTSSTFLFDDIVQLSSESLGINNDEQNGLNVFPNPANSQWTIHSENTDITLVEVFDLQGKLMLSLNPNSPIAEINASNLVKGIYLSKISTDSGTSTIKLAKK